jgi:hypothetical protein
MKKMITTLVMFILALFTNSFNGQMINPILNNDQSSNVELYELESYIDVDSLLLGNNYSYQQIVISNMLTSGISKFVFNIYDYNLVIQDQIVLVEDNADILIASNTIQISINQVSYLLTYVFDSFQGPLLHIYNLENLVSSFIGLNDMDFLITDNVDADFNIHYINERLFLTSSYLNDYALFEIELMLDEQINEIIYLDDISTTSNETIYILIDDNLVIIDATDNYVVDVTNYNALAVINNKLIALNLTDKIISMYSIDKGETNYSLVNKVDIITLDSTDNFYINLNVSNNTLLILDNNIKYLYNLSNQELEQTPAIFQYSQAHYIFNDLGKQIIATSINNVVTLTESFNNQVHELVLPLGELVLNYSYDFEFVYMLVKANTNIKFIRYDLINRVATALHQYSIANNHLVKGSYIYKDIGYLYLDTNNINDELLIIEILSTGHNIFSFTLIEDDIDYNINYYFNNSFNILINEDEARYAQLRAYLEVDGYSYIAQLQLNLDNNSFNVLPNLELGLISGGVGSTIQADHLFDVSANSYYLDITNNKLIYITKDKANSLDGANYVVIELPLKIKQAQVKYNLDPSNLLLDKSNQYDYINSYIDIDYHKNITFNTDSSKFILFGDKFVNLNKLGSLTIGGVNIELDDNNSFDIISLSGANSISISINPYFKWVQIIPNLTSLALSGLQTSFNFALKSLNESLNNYTLNIFSPTNISSSSLIPPIVLPGLDPNYVSSSSSSAIISSTSLATSSVSSFIVSSISSSLSSFSTNSIVSSNSSQNEQQNNINQENSMNLWLLLLFPLVLTASLLIVSLSTKAKENSKKKNKAKPRSKTSSRPKK